MSYEDKDALLYLADVRIDELEAENAKLQDENAKLRELCERLLTPYRLGAVTGEGVDKQWCRETYDDGSYRLRELGEDA